jgi:hypothetical protein
MFLNLTKEEPSKLTKCSLIMIRPLNGLRSQKRATQDILFFVDLISRPMNSQTSATFTLTCSKSDTNQKVLETLA